MSIEDKRVMNARRLLVVDFSGAFITFVVTAFLFATGLVPTGLPNVVLCFMAGFAAAFCLVGLWSFLFVIDARKPLRLVAVLNLSYCVATAVLYFIYFNVLTKWGLLYFPLEVAVVAFLASLEWMFTRIPMKH